MFLSFASDLHDRNVISCSFLCQSPTVFPLQLTQFLVWSFSTRDDKGGNPIPMLQRIGRDLVSRLVMFPKNLDVGQGSFLPF